MINRGLPHDVEIEILARLPVKTLVRFEAVCSLWRDTIESPYFCQLQLSYSSNHAESVLMQDHSSRPAATFYIDGRKVEAPASARFFRVYPCNGVLLLVRNESKIIRLWNPCTGKSREIPYPPTASRARGYRLLYDSVTGGFRIFRLHCDINVLVFDSSTGLDLWETVVLPRCSRSRLTSMESGARPLAFIHGGFHFVGAFGKWINNLNPMTFRLQLRFQTPSQTRPFMGRTMQGRFVVAVCGGRLCLKVITKESFEVWVMEEYGNADSWSKVSSVPLTHLLEEETIVSMSGNGLTHLLEEDGAIVSMSGNGGQIKVRKNNTLLYVRDIPSLPPQVVPMSKSYTIDYFTATLVNQ